MPEPGYADLVTINRVEDFGSPERPIGFLNLLPEPRQPVWPSLEADDPDLIKPILQILLPGIGYVIATNQASATLFIKDNFGTNELFTTVATLSGPIGIDYHAPSNSLIVSYNYDTNGQPYNFAQIYTNIVVSNSVVVTNVVITNWSGIAGLSDEVKLATVKANLGGFTNGDMYFSSSTGIGWLSANGSVSNLNWCILTNAMETNALPLRGGLYVDQTGVFSNQLIAVTSDGSASSSIKGVWRVDAQQHPTLIANIDTPHLEGVITLTNDVQKWGPWAGKIITGDEDNDPRLIYAIDTNGVVTPYDTTALIPGGVYPEDFDIIPPNQSLYACDYAANTIVKLSASYLTNYVGDLLVTQAGEPPAKAKLFIVHWDTVTTNFVTRSISYKRADGSDGRFEHVTFAPIEMPTQ